MRERYAIPNGTRIWIAKLHESNLGIHGTDFTITNGAGLRFSACTKR
ncbi:hypothetical protein BH10ACI4_BH10ACI4_33830 [soil metagenome]